MKAPRPPPISKSLSIYGNHTTHFFFSETEWIRIIAKDRQNSTVHKSLVELLDVFPRYNLRSEEGIGAAIGEIEDRIGAVASFEDMDSTSHGDDAHTTLSTPGHK